MPEFVQSVANQQMPPPYHFPGVTVHGFVFEIPMEAVQRYCDTYFNIGEEKERRFTYRCMPAFPYATLMAIRYPVMVSACDDHLAYNEVPFAQRGYVSQNEIFVAVPVLRYGTSEGSLLLDTAVEFALPFIAVDNSTSAFSGREMLGLQKLKGELDFEKPALENGFRISAKLPGWRVMQPGCVQELLPFLDITTGPPIGKGPLADPRTTPWGLLEGDHVRLGVETMAAAFSSLDKWSFGLMPNPMQVVALKQFRDARRPGVALYQALVGARTRYANITDLQLYNEKEVKISFYDFQSFRDVIRVFLDPPAQFPEDAEVQMVDVEACAAFSFNADIDFDSVRPLHTFVADGKRLSLADQPLADSPISPWLLPWRGFLGPRR
jgi:hypothetical protein